MHEADGWMRKKAGNIVDVVEKQRTMHCEKAPPQTRSEKEGAADRL